MTTPQAGNPEPVGGPGPAPAEAPHGPAAKADSELCGALLPVLLHRIRNTTQLVTGVNAVLAYGDGGRLDDARSEDLAQAAREADELGWLLAVLAGGFGTDLVGQRTEPGGLARCLELVREALRRSGGSLALPEPAAPALTAAGPGAALCLELCELVWTSASGSSAPALGFERGEAGWSLWMEGVAAPAALRDGANLGLAPQARPDGWSVVIPADWLGSLTE